MKIYVPRQFYLCCYYIMMWAASAVMEQLDRTSTIYWSTDICSRALIFLGVSFHLIRISSFLTILT